MVGLQTFSVVATFQRMLLLAPSETIIRPGGNVSFKPSFQTTRDGRTDVCIIITKDGGKKSGGRRVISLRLQWTFLRLPSGFYLVVFRPPIFWAQQSFDLSVGWTARTLPKNRSISDVTVGTYATYSSSVGKLDQAGRPASGCTGLCWQKGKINPGTQAHSKSNDISGETNK
jgi:hypothetical protein